jgi:TrmH family RNA methyltransferase
MITSLSNTRVKAVVKLRQQRRRRDTGVFVAEGRREVERARAAGLAQRELYVCPQLSADAQRRYPEALPVSEPVFRKMAYLREPEGVLGVFQQPAWRLEDLRISATTRLLLAVGTAKPGNLGAMVRTAAAAGFDAVIAAGAPVDPFNPNAIRTSTCAVFTTPTIAVDEQAAADFLLQRSIRLFAAYVDGTASHCVAHWTPPLAIAIGPEDAGLGPHWRELAQRSGGAAVRIATAGSAVDSLNASVAAGILLFEAVREA